MDKKRVTFLIIFTLVIAFASAFFSYYFFRSSYNDYAFNSNIDLASFDYSRGSFVIQDPKSVVIENDLKVEENLSYFEESVVAVIPKDNISQNNFYAFSDAILNAFIISSDGWVLVNNLGLNQFDRDIVLSKSDYLIINKKSNKLYDIVDVFYVEDSNFLMLKMGSNANFRVNDFARASDLKLGQSLLLYNFNNIMPNFIRKLPEVDGVLDASDLNNEIFLSNEIDSAFANSFVFNMNSELVALIDSDLAVRPISDFRNMIYGLLVNSEHKDFNLGFYYVNLSSLASNRSNFYNEGALIYNEDGPAIVPGSLSDRFGLKEGDIILKINDIEINKDRTFYALLSDLLPVSLLKFTVLRDGDIIDLNIEL